MSAYQLEDFAQDPLEVARALIGARLVHHHPERGPVEATIVETEAYRGEDDQACHARAGRTARTAVMYGPPAVAYVYLIYGMHQMLNVVAWPQGEPAAVLIRAVEPVPGPGWAPEQLQSRSKSTAGPGRLTRAMGIERSHNATPFCLGETAADVPLQALGLLPGPTGQPVPIDTSPRIGIDYAGEWAQKPWRFTLRESPWLSRK